MSDPLIEERTVGCGSLIVVYGFGTHGGQSIYVVPMVLAESGRETVVNHPDRTETID